MYEAIARSVRHYSLRSPCEGIVELSTEREGAAESRFSLFP